MIIFFFFFFFFFQAEDGIRDRTVTGVQTCALPIYQTRSHQINHLAMALWWSSCRFFHWRCDSCGKLPGLRRSLKKKTEGHIRPPPAARSVVRLRLRFLHRLLG